MDENSVLVLEDGERVTVKDFFKFAGQTVPWPPRQQVDFPDAPEGEGRETDQYALRQFDWYKGQPYDQRNTWLYDRVQCLYELGLRTGNAEVLAEAKRSALEYVKHYDTGAYGLNWVGAGVRNGDMKYTYVSAIYYLKTVEGIEVDVDLNALSDALWRVGWFGISWERPWEEQRDLWNERAAGYSLMGMYWLTRLGVEGAGVRLVRMLEYLENAQSADGWWWHSYNGHEGTSGTDVLCASPWMSCIIGGALTRIGDSGDWPTADRLLARLAKAQEQALAQNEQWMHAHNKTGYGSRYFVMKDAERQAQVQRSSGWYSDTHLPEVWHCMKAGGVEPPFDIADFYTDAMVDVQKPPRLFAWQHSHF